MPGTQKALVVKEVGTPVTLVTDWPIPEPTDDQVQVKVTVAGLNPHDHKARDHGLFIANNLPGCLANDVVGKVSKLGPGVSGLAVGDRVLYHPRFTPGSTQLGLQEYSVADVSALTKIPDSISDDVAATLPTNIIAPLVALFDKLQIPAPWAPEAKNFDYAGTTLLVVGGGSNCGRFGVQLAKFAGIGRIVVVGGNEDELKSYGATHIIDRHADFDTLLTRIRDIVGDDLIYAYDAVSPLDGQLLALNVLSSHKKGALARLLPLGPVDESKVIGKKAGFQLHDVIGISHNFPYLTKPFWSKSMELIQAGHIRPSAYAVKDGLSADNVNEVLDAYRDGKPITKTHIHF